MSILDQLGGMLNEHSSGSGTAPDQATQQFHQVASQAPQSTLSSILGSIFQSPETGSFGQNVSQMYAQSDPHQQAGILNTLLHSAGPGILSSLGINLPGGSAGSTVTPEQAQQIPPDQIEHIANHAQQQNPDIVHKAGEFYAQHPQLVQALGAGAALWALQRIRK
jgi:hypothetical protein